MRLQAFPVLGSNINPVPDSETTPESSAWTQTPLQSPRQLSPLLLLPQRGKEQTAKHKILTN